MPARAHAGDAGYDLRSVDEASLPPGGRALIRTGISIAIPGGYAGLVLPRSGLAMRHGVAPVNTPGLIDSGYRGEVMVPLINHDPEATFRVGERHEDSPARPGAGGGSRFLRGRDARGRDGRQGRGGFRFFGVLA